MNSLISKLWELTKIGRIQNADLLLGENLQKLHSLMIEKPEEIPEDMESLFIQLFTINNRQISTINAHYIGLCIVLYYKSLKKPSYWTILPVFQEEVLKQNLPVIVIFGIFTRHLCDSFKSKLPPSISFLLQCTTESLQPHICQFFRRVIKGSGSFLKSSVQEIFGFVFRGASSTNEALRIEAVKTLPCLMSCAQIPRKKLLPIVGLSLATTSRALRDASAKALAKLMLISTKEQKDDEAQSDKYFNIAFKILVQFMTNEKNIPTLALAFHIFLRYFQPIEIVRKFRVLAKLALSISAFSIPFSSLCMMSRAIFHAISNVTGTSAGLSLNHFIVEKLEPDTTSPAKAAVILDSLVNFDASSKVLAKAAKAFYPLLTSSRSDVRHLVVSLFAKLGAKEPKAAQILLDSFMKWVSSADAKQVDIDGFSRGAAILIMTSDASTESLTKIEAVTVSWLKQIAKLDSPRIPAALLLLSAIMKKRPELISKENIAAICVFLTKYFKMSPTISQRNLVPKQVLKFTACLLLQIVRNPPENYDLIQPVFKQAFASIVTNQQQLSAPALLALLNFAKKCKFLWERDANVPYQMCSLIISSFQRFFSLLGCDTDYNLSKYEVDLDQSALLYGAELPLHVGNKVDQSIHSLYSYLIEDEHCSRSVQLCNACLRDFGAWMILCQPKHQKSVITQLFSMHPKEVNTQASRLLLLRALFVKKCVNETPADSLSILLQIQTFGNRRCIRLLAAAVAAYASAVPKVMPQLIDFLELPKTSPIFASYAIAELDFASNDDLNAIRCLLVLQRILVSTETPEGIFALAQMAEKKVIPADFTIQMVSVIEQIVYSDYSRLPSAQYYAGKAIEHMNPTVAQEELKRISHCLFDFAVHKTLARMLSIHILKLVNDYEEFMPRLRLLTEITAPLPILVSRFFFPATLEDAPMLFMILQQSQDSVIEKYLMRIFEANADVKKWTDLCKRVVIIGCVPPAERKGDIRIVPIFPVLLCAIKIAEQLVQKIRDGFPNNMTCVDDIVSISFNSIRMNEREFDAHCFNTMAHIVRSFCNVRNKECAMLELYTSQFVPSLKYATNGTHDSGSGANFCLAYLAFLMESRSPFLGEATSTLVEGLGKIGYTESNVAVFCRIIGRLFTLLEKKDEKLTALFSAASKHVFDGIFKQERKISELGDEMQFVIASFLDLNKSKEVRRALVLVLLEELQNNCCAMILNTLTTLFEQIGAQLFDIDFAVSVLAHSQLIIEEWQKVEEKEKSTEEGEEEDNLDNTTFWLVPTKRMPAVGRFLTASASLIPNPLTKEWENVWRNLLALSITGNICYTAIAKLVNCASDTIIAELGPSLVIEILRKEECEAQKTLIYYILSRIPANIISSMFHEIASTSVLLSTRFSVIRTALRFGGVPDDNSLDCIAGIVSAALFPDGLSFVGSLLADEKTAFTALMLLKLGVADAIAAEAESSILHAPKILHFLRLACNVIGKIAPEVSEEFFDAVGKITVSLLSTVSSIKDRKPVVIPACAILKSIGKSAEKAFAESDMKKVIESLTPPRYAQSIQLKAFGDVKSRKSSSSSGWQSLDVCDSSDED